MWMRVIHLRESRMERVFEYTQKQKDISHLLSVSVSLCLFLRSIGILVQVEEIYVEMKQRKRI